MSSWGHAVRRATEQEIAAHRRRTTCTMPKCTQPFTHVTSYRYVTGRAGRVSWAERRVCTEHAERFAGKHEVEISEAPESPPEHASQSALRQGSRYWAVDSGHTDDGRPTS